MAICFKLTSLLRVRLISSNERPVLIRFLDFEIQRGKGTEKKVALFRQTRMNFDASLVRMTQDILFNWWNYLQSHSG